MNNRRFFLILISIILTVNAFAQARYEDNWKSLDSRPIPHWFEDAKFGIFIHWGVYSVPSWAPNTGEVYSKYAEWYWKRLEGGSKECEKFLAFHDSIYGRKFKYQDFAPMFKAELFQPDEWADLIARSGAQYVVLTSKHHEGFTLWPSAESVNWNSVDIGPHRDLCGELTKAVKAKNLHMGFYYSLYEWYNPIYKTNLSEYVDEHMIPQMKDLINRYHPDILWTDGEWEHTSKEWKAEQFLQWLYNASPVKETIVVNDRWGKDTRGKHGGFYTTEYDLVNNENALHKVFTHPWEECRGIAGSFGYNRNENVEDYSSAEQLINLLIEKVSRGGNLLLNIGPTSDGRIPVIMQERLLQIGQWLMTNGEAIYGTRQWLDGAQQNNALKFTEKGRTLYLFLTDHSMRTVRINGVKHVKSISLLGCRENVSWRESGNGIAVSLPLLTIDEVPSPYAWVLKINR